MEEKKENSLLGDLASKGINRLLYKGGSKIVSSVLRSSMLGSSSFWIAALLFFVVFIALVLPALQGMSDQQTLIMENPALN